MPDKPEEDFNSNPLSSLRAQLQRGNGKGLRRGLRSVAGIVLRWPPRFPVFVAVRFDVSTVCQVGRSSCSRERRSPVNIARRQPHFEKNTRQPREASAVGSASGLITNTYFIRTTQVEMGWR